MSKTKQIILILALVFLCLCEILFDPLTPYLNRIKLYTIQVELNAARTKWTSKNIQNYYYEVEYSLSMSGSCGAKITVKEGKLANVVVTMDNGFKKLPRFITLPRDKWNYNNCDYSKVTIPEVFKTVQMFLKRTISLDVFFEHEFGFINEYYGHPNFGIGVLTPLVSDGGFSYKFSNFQNLDGTTQ